MATWSSSIGITSTTDATTSITATNSSRGDAGGELSPWRKIFHQLLVGGKVVAEGRRDEGVGSGAWGGYLVVCCHLPTHTCTHSLIMDYHPPPLPPHSPVCHHYHLLLFFVLIHLLLLLLVQDLLLLCVSSLSSSLPPPFLPPASMAWFNILNHLGAWKTSGNSNSTKLHLWTPVIVTLDGLAASPGGDCLKFLEFPQQDSWVSYQSFTCGLSDM